MNEDLKSILKEIGTSDPGKELRKYLDEELEKMKGDIDSVESWDDVLARRKAKKIINNLFYFLDEEPQQRKVKNQYL